MRKKLGANNMLDIEKSLFGHLFEVHPLQFQGQLHVILCKVPRSSSIERMCLEFDIGNFIVEFGPADFALVSGLNIRGPIETPEQSDFHTKILNGIDKVTFDDIKTDFSLHVGTPGFSFGLTVGVFVHHVRCSSNGSKIGYESFN